MNHPKKVWAGFFVPVFFLALTAGCMSARPKLLDPSDITGTAVLTKVTVMVRSTVDQGKGEQFIREVLPAYIEEIVNGIKKEKGITIDASMFVSEMSSGDVSIDLEVFDMGGDRDINIYTWEGESDESLRAFFLLPIVVREDGSMPLRVTIHQDDPKYEPGREYSFDFSLKVESK
ncbi:hypothetical protein Spith_0216 [Spirochaeta thermophila DSM 6578]|uniref:Lipoprotein n=1 Tax=Winmispira thermophila (strain ATCC 700085 / DSM 6578 / Z-1203) TaxID=869211 RepID=G0GCT4_WINT7|nr:hypothetical protein [Spirochaeta thermophila]AEJ60503.1 hypothetical protein Spith_0216 [Spirochaeta thermophila DSM 6578]